MQRNIVKYILIAGVAGNLLSGGLVYAQASRLDELREQARERAEAAKEHMEQLREQAKERAKAAREETQQKINQIKDQAKKEAADRIEGQFDHINDVWTNHFTNVLDKLDEVLQKIESRTEKASANGQDVATVKFAIQDALTKISTARTAVAGQAQKTYVVDTTSITQTTSTEGGQSNLVSKLRDQFRTLRDQLSMDLNSLRDGKMKDARTAVQDALQKLSSVSNVDKEPETNSNNQ